MQPSIAPSTPIPRQETVELVYRIFGDVLVPLEQVRERWFRNLNKENFSKALACGRIALPVTTLDDSHKAMQFVALDHLAAYVDQRANQAGGARRAPPGADSIAPLSGPPLPTSRGATPCSARRISHRDIRPTKAVPRRAKPMRGSSRAQKRRMTQTPSAFFSSASRRLIRRSARPAPRRGTSPGAC